VEEEELFQVGCVGLLKAIDQFDLSYDVKFSTYAVPVILGEIRRQLRDFSAVKVSRSKKQLAAAVKEARQRLVQLAGREPTMQELAAELGVDTAEVAGALEATRVPLSLFEKVGTAREAPELIDTLAGSGEEWFESIALRQVLEQLEPRERQIILLRFFRDRTQAEVGAVVGLSQVQVSRIERRVLKTLRERLSS
jgi:RNA polymerase sporulation-specific sigma factor